MSGKNTAVFGIYPTHESADAAVDTLRAKGVPEHRHLGAVSAERRLEGVRPREGHEIR